MGADHAEPSVASLTCRLAPKIARKCLSAAHAWVLDDWARMHEVQFFALTRPVQDRFIELTRGKGTPKPLLFQAPPPNPWALGLNITGAVLVMASLVYASLGFGSLRHAYALQRPSAIGVYVALLCAGGLALVAALRIRNRTSDLPFRPGTYVFPSGVVVAATAQLKVYGAADFLDAEFSSPRLRLRFKGGQFEFGLTNASYVDEIKAAFQTTLQKLNLPPTEQTHRSLTLLDPLVDTGFKSLFAPSESIRPQVPKKTGLWLWWTLLCAAIVGSGLWYLRNLLSEKQMLVKARTVNTVDAYQSYLARGGHREDVINLLLPRAELLQARKAATANAIEHFIDAHPNSKINGEAMAALERTLLSELEGVSAQGTVAALRDFRKQDPYSKLVESDRQVALRRLF